MNNSALKCQQDELFNTLCKFDKFCKQEGINYFICAGTLLGAVKYQGFIPWDDDLDVYMLRSDFEKVVTKLNSLKDLQLKLVKVFFNDRIMSTQEGTNSFIDISVLDNAPRTWLASQLVFMAQLIMRASLYDKIILNQPSYVKKFNFLMRVFISRILRLSISKNNIYRLQTWISCLCNKQKTDFLYLSCSDTRYLRTRFPRDWFSNIAYYQFCGKNFPSMQKASSYLKKQYGNIEIDPPPELQVPQHVGLGSYIYDYYSE